VSELDATRVDQWADVLEEEFCGLAFWRLKAETKRRVCRRVAGWIAQDMEALLEMERAALSAGPEETS
jgi:hypothetical protein